MVDRGLEANWVGIGEVEEADFRGVSGFCEANVGRINSGVEAAKACCCVEIQFGVVGDSGINIEVDFDDLLHRLVLLNVSWFGVVGDSGIEIAAGCHDDLLMVISRFVWLGLESGMNDRLTYPDDILQSRR